MKYKNIFPDQNQKPAGASWSKVVAGSLSLSVGLALFTGCVSRPTNVAPQVATTNDLNVGQPTQPPPKNQRDVIPLAPGPRTQWYFIEGHWAWRGEWAWVPGHWRVRPHPGDVWRRGKWVEQGNVYVWQSGHWRSGAPADEESTDR